MRSYRRPQYTRTVALPVREEIFTRTIAEVRLRRSAHTSDFSTLKPLLCQ
jgi:hypothetical protein